MLKNLTRIIIKNNVRIYLSDYTDVVDQVFLIHNYLPLPNLIIAHAISAFGPLRFLYDTNDLLVRMQTNGAIKELILEIKNQDLRILLSNPNISTEYDKKGYNTIPLILGIGDSGTLKISRFLNGQVKDSHTPLVRADIITDLAYHLNNSDQIFSAIVNDVKLDPTDPNQIKKAKSAIFQLLPDYEESDIQWIENFIKEFPLEKYSIDEYEKLIDGDNLATKTIGAICWCSRERVLRAINLLSDQEKQSVFENDNKIESKCEFCHHTYIIKREELLN